MFTLSQLQVEHLEPFLDVFGSEGVEMRSGHGCVGSRVFSTPEDENTVFVLLEWRDAAAYEAFRSDPGLPELMAKAGVTEAPGYIVLEAAARFDG